MILKQQEKKRTNSLNTESYKDKKQKKDIYIDNFIETSRFINIIMERLNMLEDECNRLDVNNVALKDEYKLLKDNYTKLQSKNSNLTKEVNSLKAINTKLQYDLTNLDTKLTNQNVDEMNGVQINNLSAASFANILKNKDDKIISEPMVEIINTFNDYSKQKKGRENNVIIFGLKNTNKETASDNVKNLLNKMNTKNIKFKNPILLVKNGATNTSPQIKITLENEETKFQLLKAAKILREINRNENMNISISQDLNEVDRLLH